MDDSKKYEGVIGPKQRAAMIKADNYSQELARTQKNLRAVSMERDSEREAQQKAEAAHLQTCKDAQTEIDKLHAENVCLQELVQEFYEWSRRDYPTEAEVREIMNRYYDLLNK